MTASFIATPLGRYTNPRRDFPLAAVFTVAVNAGTMASRSGNANVAPKPRRNVLRGSAIFLMIMTEASASEMEDY